MIVFFQQEQHCKTINIRTNDQSAKIIIHAYIERKELKRRLIFFFKNKNIFAWSCTDLKGVSSKICDHKIILENSAILIQQCQHWFNPKCSLLVKEKLNKLFRFGFIYHVLHNEWVSPIVMVPKKNGKI